MGILVKLLMLPITSPVNGLAFIARKLQEQAEDEFYDEGTVRSTLVELELAYELGEIDEEEYQESEDALLAWLKLIREHKSAMREP